MTVVRKLLEALAPLALAALIVLGLASVSAAARSRVEAHPSRWVPFGTIDCPPPPGMTRSELIDEVQYLSEVPDRVAVLAPDGMAALAGAFARHPWVENVQRVEVLPSRQVRAQLVYRRAVLAVRLPQVSAVNVAGSAALLGPAPHRAVDRHGVLLPVSADTNSLLVLETTVRTPQGAPGMAWGDARVHAAARLADLLESHHGEMDLTGMLLEIDGPDFVLRQGPVRFAWGRAPGEERKNEASVSTKLRRLQDVVAASRGTPDARRASRR